MPGSIRASMRPRDEPDGITPCRLADTRNATLRRTSLAARATRGFAVADARAMPAELRPIR